MNRINEKEYYAYMESHLSNGEYECIEFMLKGSEVNDICNIDDCTARHSCFEYAGYFSFQ